MRRILILTTAVLAIPITTFAAQADFAPIVERITGVRDWIYGPVADFVGATSILIALGTFTIFPKGLAAAIQRVVYVILLGTGPLVVPILMAAAH